MISEKKRLATKIAMRYLRATPHKEVVFVEAVVDTPEMLIEHIKHAVAKLYMQNPSLPLPNLNDPKWSLFAHHMTIKFIGGAPIDSIKEYLPLLSSKIDLKIKGIIADTNCVALVVEPPAHLMVHSMSSPHITIALANQTKPVYSNYLIDHNTLIPLHGDVTCTIAYSDEKKIDRYTTGHLNKTASEREDNLGLLPIFNPLFNLREMCKQILLLEDHLNNVRKRCPDCICKHFMTIEALAEEAISLDVKGEYWDRLDGLAQHVRDLQNKWMRAIVIRDGDESNRRILGIAQSLRLLRKDIAPLCMQVVIDGGLKIATKTEAEKEEEQVEGMIKKEPKAKPPRTDLMKKRLKDTDPDLEDLSGDGDKDLSLNYKKVGG
jgi:hypothetical protein